MINGRTRLHVVANGAMTGQRYIDEVLLPHVRLFRGAVGDKFVFMDDNATCHRTLAVQDCLDSEGIQRLVWPARSPDLNHIENVWDALGRQVAGRNYPPTNKNTLIRALTEEWDKLPQQLLDNVVQSMEMIQMGSSLYEFLANVAPKDSAIDVVMFSDSNDTSKPLHLDITDSKKLSEALEYHVKTFRPIFDVCLSCGFEKALAVIQDSSPSPIIILIAWESALISEKPSVLVESIRRYPKNARLHLVLVEDTETEIVPVDMINAVRSLGGLIYSLPKELVFMASKLQLISSNIVKNHLQLEDRILVIHEANYHNISANFMDSFTTPSGGFERMVYYMYCNPNRNSVIRSNNVNCTSLGRPTTDVGAFKCGEIRDFTEETVPMRNWQYSFSYLVSTTPVHCSSIAMLITSSSSTSTSTGSFTMRGWLSEYVISIPENALVIYVEIIGSLRKFKVHAQISGPGRASPILIELRDNGNGARRRFVEWAQNEIAVVPDFHKRILFSDEAHFWLNGYVNKQNCRIWSEANPQVYVETPLHPEQLTVRGALWSGGIIGPHFFKNDEGHNVTVNGDRYRAMITKFFIPELNNHDVQELWFQQDGATCHTARATIDLLKDTFGDRLISRFGPVNWPPRSCDLTPLDYFLWGYVKSLVYADKPQTLDHLEDNIRRVIADIRPQMLEKVIENWTSRLDYIRASRGSPMPEIIFKIRHTIYQHYIFSRKAADSPVALCLDPDVKANDGIYSRYFTSLTNKGTCTVSVSAELKTEASGISEGNQRMEHSPSQKKDIGFFYVNKPAPDIDILPPNRIADLNVVSVNHENRMVQLQWTAPGNDYDFGQASAYEIKYSQQPSSLSDLYFNGEENLMMETASSLSPNVSGDTELNEFYFPEIYGSEVYYVALRAADANNNTGGISNIVQIFLNQSNTVITDKTISSTESTKPTFPEIQTTNNSTDGTVQTSDAYEITSTINENKSTVPPQPKDNYEFFDEKTIIILSSAGGILLLIIIINIIICCCYIKKRERSTGSKKISRKASLRPPYNINIAYQNESNSSGNTDNLTRISTSTLADPNEYSQPQARNKTSSPSYSYHTSRSIEAKARKDSRELGFKLVQTHPAYATSSLSHYSARLREVDTESETEFKSPVPQPQTPTITKDAHIYPLGVV
ncbi:calcium-activated chloride channel regulator 1 [Trichonephila clavipes]|nr:calcium-activated chloride channel regulator 1 [Trichonephila clavipes]